MKSYYIDLDIFNRDKELGLNTSVKYLCDVPYHVYIPLTNDLQIRFWMENTGTPIYVLDIVVYSNLLEVFTSSPRVYESFTYCFESYYDRENYIHFTASTHDELHEIIEVFFDSYISEKPNATT